MLPGIEDRAVWFKKEYHISKGSYDTHFMGKEKFSGGKVFFPHVNVFFRETLPVAVSLCDH